MQTTQRGWAQRLIALAVVTAMVGAPPAALAGPATDEYRLDLPSAAGKKNDDSVDPTTRVEALPPAVAKQLRNDPDGRALAAIATAEELGAPKIGKARTEVRTQARTGSDNEAPSLASAIGGSLIDPLVLGLMVVLIALGVALFQLRRRLVGESRPDDPG